MALVAGMAVAWFVATIISHFVGSVYAQEQTNSYTVRVTHRVTSSYIAEDLSEVTPTPSPTTTPVSHKLDISDLKKTDSASGVSDQEIKDYIRSKDWDDSIAIRVAKSENAWNLTRSFDCARVGYNNDKHNSRDRGIFQINDYWHPHFSDEQAFDCFENIDYAYEIYKSRGNWSAWYAYSNGSYLNHTAD